MKFLLFQFHFRFGSCWTLYCSMGIRREREIFVHIIIKVPWGSFYNRTLYLMRFNARRYALNSELYLFISMCVCVYMYKFLFTICSAYLFIFFLSTFFLFGSFEKLHTRQHKSVQTLNKSLKIKVFSVHLAAIRCYYQSSIIFILHVRTWEKTKKNVHINYGCVLVI